MYNKDYINKYKNLVKNNLHTIESHSVTHGNYANNNFLGKGGGPNKLFEYTDSQKLIRKEFGNKYATTFCYPHGSIPTDENVMKQARKIYSAARTVEYGYYKKGDDPMRLKCIPIEKINNNNILTAIKNNYVIITYGHGIKGISGWNPVDENLLLNHFKYLELYKDDIWFTTLPKLMEYLQSTKQL